ncbi:Uncharacterised protein [Chlamydia trachomatis]|nr:Uncharacterised protein [Chlamydia trachomatis]
MLIAHLTHQFLATTAGAPCLFACFIATYVNILRWEYIHDLTQNYFQEGVALLIAYTKITLIRQCLATTA